MAIISFNPDDWAARTTGFPRLVQSLLFDISLHNWRTGTAMSLAHYRIITADLGDEQAMAIAEMLLGAGRIEQGDDGSIWSPEAVEEWQRADKLRQQRSRGGKATAGVPKRRAKPAPRKTPTAAPKQPEKIEAIPAPPDAATEAAVRMLSEQEQARQEVAENVKRLAQAWNAMAMQHGLGQIEVMGAARTREASARVREHGIAKLLAAISTIPASPFLMGTNEKGWKASFDWLLRAEKCERLVSGHYGGGQ